MSEQVAARIRRRVEERGPITFAGFMEEALYGAGGFYERPPVGPEGHFVTSPHVHPFVFSHCLRAALLEAWGALGEPRPFHIIEVGAGDGTLARALLSAFAEEGLGLDVRYTTVERSPGARAALSALPVEVFDRMEDVESLDRVVVFANELLDNLPFRRVRWTASGPVEVRVGSRGSDLVEVEVALDDDLAALTARTQQAGEVTVPVGAFGFVDDLAGRLERGYVLLIDYGSEGEHAGDVHGYRGHRVTENVLDDPGSADITVGVDLASIAERAERRGLRALGCVRQARAIGALGYERWSATMRERQAELQAAGRRTDAVRVWNARSRASLLVDRTGLGRLQWLLLASQSLPTPTWLRAAAERSVEGPA